MSKTHDIHEATKGLALAQLAHRVMSEKHGIDVNLWDVREISGITDFYLVTSGTSTPHLKALFNEVQVSLKQEGAQCYRKSGVPESGWLVIDYVDLIIHIFSKELREYYAIEALWAEAPRLED